MARLGEFERERCFMDDVGMPYPIRGIEENNKWTYSTLTYDQMQALNTPFLIASINLYGNYSAFNTLPHGMGTLSERQSVLDILKILRQEENLFDAWEREKSK